MRRLLTILVGGLVAALLAGKAVGGDGLVAPLDILIAKASEAPPEEFVISHDGGTAISLADLRGRLVVLNIWATWCLPCRDEMPSLDRLSDLVDARDVAVLPISVDARAERAVRPFYFTIDIKNLPVLTASGRDVVAAFHDQTMPFTVILGRDGREIGRVRGPARWDDPVFVAWLEEKAKAAD
ncbi:MAG TPA: TlpA family protein disulfide reductase [Kaistiaceae bacterium]|nr:TlpA family protein disulfide reductase [Kaistiaceae bacterium]